MRHLFLPGCDLSQPTFQIEGPDAHHLLNVLRVRIGEALTLLDDAGGACLAEVSETGKRTITVRSIGPAAVPPEPPVRITVAQALGKGDKFEQVVQHAAEVGATGFIPLVTERTIVRLQAREAISKRERWSLIAKGAAEQAGRARIPTMGDVTLLRELAIRFSEFESVLLLQPQDAEKGGRGEGRKRRQLIASLLLFFPSSLLLIVGPEGGFTPAEIEMAEAAGAVLTSLSPYTLRTETAALVAVSQILYEASRE